MPLNIKKVPLGIKVTTYIASVFLCFSLICLSAVEATSSTINVLVQPIENPNSNCYGYVLGVIGSQPGDFGDPGYQWLEWPQSQIDHELAKVVKKDLAALGHTNITISDNYATPPSGFAVIALRTGTFGTGGRQFHFMINRGDNTWYHKPGGTPVLRSIHGANSDYSWIYEWWDGSRFVRSSYKCDNTIYYITFKKDVSPNPPGCVWNGYIWICPYILPVTEFELD